MRNPYAVIVAAGCVIRGDDIPWIIVVDCFQMVPILTEKPAPLLFG